MDKKWYQSKAVWGGLIAVLAAVAGAFGVDIGAEEQSLLADHALELVGAVGGVLAIYGRIKADGRIK